MKLADEPTRAELREEWARMSRGERRRAIRALGIFAAVDLVGVHPAEAVLCLNGPTETADRIVRSALLTCRNFFRSRVAS